VVKLSGMFELIVFTAVLAVGFSFIWLEMGFGAWVKRYLLYPLILIGSRRPRLDALKLADREKVNMIRRNICPGCGVGIGWRRVHEGIHEGCCVLPRFCPSCGLKVRP
jgi:hypothetical protein